jgi:hypothetical protein
MTTKQPTKAAGHLRAVAEGREKPDYRRLPSDVDPEKLVETHDVEPEVSEPRSIWATPDLEDMARTNAIGGI